MGKTRPPFPAEFRQEIVRLVRAGRSANSLAREFEPSAVTIRKWVKQADLDEGRRSDGPTSQDLDELRKLRSEVRRLREEREILKKAAAWFAQESNSIPKKGSGS